MGLTPHARQKTNNRGGETAFDRSYFKSIEYYPILCSEQNATIVLLLNPGGGAKG